MIAPLARLALFALLALAPAIADGVAAQDRPRPDGPPPNRPPPGRQRADPGMVAATDFAFARAARDNGQWTAFREYAAPGAMLHQDGGPIDAAGFLTRRADPPQAVRWAPGEVWSSCDGSLAVSFGRSRQPDGVVGSYVTVWQRQRNGDYRWIYDTGTPDDPQPVAPAPITPDGDTIVVTEITAIRARSADCNAPSGLPMDTLSAMPGDAQSGGGEARDGSLRWRWEHHAPGKWRVVVDWVREGAWQEALAFDVPEA